MVDPTWLSILFPQWGVLRTLQNKPNIIEQRVVDHVRRAEAFRAWRRGSVSRTETPQFAPPGGPLQKAQRPADLTTEAKKELRNSADRTFASARSGTFSTKYPHEPASTPKGLT